MWWYNNYMLIYKITEKSTNMAYIGQTSNLEKRLEGHFWQNSIIGIRIRDYGWDAFIIEVLKICESKIDLNISEDVFIKTHNTLMPHGYNMQTGGNKGKKASTVFREKISNIRKQDKTVPSDCQIIKRNDSGKFRLRIWSPNDATRLSLGQFETKEDALNHYNFCKNKDKWIKWQNPQIDHQRGKFRLRTYGTTPRTFMGIFDTYDKALKFYKEVFYASY